MDAFYALSKVIALLASLATMTVLVVLDRPYWAIYPAVLSFLSVMSVLVTPTVGEKTPEERD